MHDEVGLWIDHREAVIVAITDTGEEIERIESNFEGQNGRAGTSPLRGSHDSRRVPADDSRERVKNEHLNVYYDAVIASIRDAESILILGPGEAKGELKKRMEREHLGGRIIGVETVDKMSDRQIVARVRERFVK